ncbi:MAG: cytochrome c [Rhizobiales bacterium]|nr:cytochrome c [Hyphomicrobiales bacterium]OJY06381.1 MAG: cytochrome C [Rhizobiales bacterium 63-22]
MRLFFLSLGAAAILTAGVAHADAIADRQAIMKSFGHSVGTIAPMIKGDKPFDAAAVLAALETIDTGAKKLDFDTLFPAGSDKGKTAASPKIWQDKDEFVKHIDKLRSDAAAAVAAKPQSLDALKPVFRQVASNCGACHQDFRLKRN